MAFFSFSTLRRRTLVSMLPHAMITVRDTKGDVIAIPVTNFPTLPEGSHIDLYLTDEVLFESATLTGYSISNKAGVWIDVDIAMGESSISDEYQDRDWNNLAKLCVKDPSNNFSWIYPHTVDYGVKFPMPPE